MSKKRKHRNMGRQLTRLMLTSALGVGLTMILIMVGAWMVLQGKTGESGMSIGLQTAVVLGSMMTSILNHSSISGAVPRVLISSVGFMFMLLLLTFLLGQHSTVLIFPWRIVAASALGSIMGMVTNLVKSNKSYINKSKRKRSITFSYHI